MERTERGRELREEEKRIRIKREAARTARENARE